MSRPGIVAGNWKMNKLAAEAVALVTELVPLVKQAVAEVVVVPPFTALSRVATALEGVRGIALGAQNCHPAPSGAYTGEISAAMLKDAGCRYVIVGHSERRQLFNERDGDVNVKAHAVLEAGLVPIVCVGETLAEREAGETMAVVERQVTKGLARLSAGQVAGLVLAYEPVWAIGTGRNATAEQAQEVHRHIREVVAGAFGADAAGKVRIQYGGSVKPDNAAALLGQPDVDGALVGGASLKAVDFAAIVNAATR